MLPSGPTPRSGWTDRRVRFWAAVRMAASASTSMSSMRPPGSLADQCSPTAYARGTSRHESGTLLADAYDPTPAVASSAIS